MNIGLIDVDSHNFPNLSLMKLSSYHKLRGHKVELAIPMFGHYDRIYASKVFTFSKDFNPLEYHADEIIKGGTGYDITSTLPPEIDKHLGLDYSIYPQHRYSVQLFSRGCIRRCPFCIVHDKEGDIHPVEPMELNPQGQWIEVLDNNFFANPEWKSAVNYLLGTGQIVNLHGVDVRIMNEEQAYWLNKLPIKRSIHIAWDLPQIDLAEKLREVTRYIKPYKLTCYVLVGFGSTVEQDMYRIETLRDLGIKPFVMPYRDFDNKRVPTQYEKDLARYVNKPQLFQTMPFSDFSPRKGFKCLKYLLDAQTH